MTYATSLEYFPPLRPAKRGRPATCASAWFHSWLCSLPPNPMDMAGLTVGKTLLQRVVNTYEATLNRNSPPTRPIYSLKYLNIWPWRPKNIAPVPMQARACVFNGMDWGSGDAEAWLVQDSCAQLGGQVPTTWLPSQDYVVKAVEEILLPALYATPSDTFALGCSTSNLWWASQLTIQSLASFGKCSVLSAQLLKRHSSAAPASSAVSRHSSRTEEALSMQVRRGDSCMRWAHKRGDSRMRKGRPCFPTDM